jgi:hypothetical protein
MSPVLVIILDVIVHQALQMPLVHNDDMIEQITATVAHPALGNSVPLSCESWFVLV